MKRILRFLFSCLTATLFIACDVLEQPKLIITGEASHISCRNAAITGKANLAESPATDLALGVLYSIAPDVLPSNSVRIPAEFFDADYNFTVKTEILEPETKYYYRSYISQAGVITYGDTKSFTTLPVSTMIKTEDVTDIEAAVATLHGILDLTDCEYDTIDYGFRLIHDGGATTTLKPKTLSGNSFSVKAEGLSRESNYEVAAYVVLDERTYLAEKRTFSTQSIRAGVILNSASEITELKAKISGKLEVESQGSFEKTATLYYSMTATTADALRSQGISIPVTPNDADGSFSETLVNLTPGTKYRYVVIAIVDGIEFSSEVKAFSTVDFSVNVTTADATAVKYATATLNGLLDVSSIESLSEDVWFFYSETATTTDALLLNGTKTSATLSGSTFSADLSGLAYETTYYYVACAKVHEKETRGTVKSFTTKQLPAGAVDMGLSVLWHQSNLGASNPEEYGDYYAWGEIEPKPSYDWQSYSLSNGSGNTITKYCTDSSYGTVDNKTTLDPEDDAPHVKLGGTWRIPTDVEWRELMSTDHCTWAWTSLNGVNGYLVTSKRTGNSVFFPAAGWRSGDYLRDEGTLCDYWSSSLYQGDSSTACDAYLHVEQVSMSYWHRCSGNPVRPVSD